MAFERNMELILIAAGIIFLFFSYRYFLNRHRKKFGQEGEIYVHRFLKFSLFFTKSYVYHDIIFDLGGGHLTQVDHVIVSNRGVFCIETKRMNGVIKGRKEDKYWYHTNHKGGSHRFYNPFFQNSTHIKAIAQNLGLATSEITGYVLNVGDAKLKGNIAPIFGQKVYRSVLFVVFKILCQSKKNIDQTRLSDLIGIMNEIKYSNTKQLKKEHLSYIKSKKKWL